MQIIVVPASNFRFLEVEFKMGFRRQSGEKIKWLTEHLNKWKVFTCLIPSHYPKKRGFILALGQRVEPCKLLLYSPTVKCTFKTTDLWCKYNMLLWSHLFPMTYSGFSFLDINNVVFESHDFCAIWNKWILGYICTIYQLFWMCI